MGNGAICKKGKRFDKSVQMPSISSIPSPKRSSTSSSLSRSYKMLSTKPPPPLVTVREEGFKVKQNVDQYSSIWDHNAQVSS
jgi:hypothetical protein